MTISLSAAPWLPLRRAGASRSCAGRTAHLTCSPRNACIVLGKEDAWTALAVSRDSEGTGLPEPRSSLSRLRWAPPEDATVHPHTALGKASR